MIEAGITIAFAMFTWWFSTGVILFLNQLPKSTFMWSMAAATCVAGIGVWAILATLNEMTASGAYAAFLGGLALWGWHELSFLTGFVTGPRKEPCPEGLAGWSRFKAATATLITHEVAIFFLTLIALAAISFRADNQTALVTFGCLWVLRLSAKFNIFLGIPNITEEFLPAHLEYLKSYFRNRPMNALFPISVTAGCVGAVALLLPALQPGAEPYAETSALLVGTLVALGVLEHWFMVLPLPDAALWRWAMLPKRFSDQRSNEHVSRLDLNHRPAPERPIVKPRTCESCQPPTLAKTLIGVKP